MLYGYMWRVRGGNCCSRLQSADALEAQHNADANAVAGSAPACVRATAADERLAEPGAFARLVAASLETSTPRNNFGLGS
jgi:hypothetical protein